MFPCPEQNPGASELEQAWRRVKGRLLHGSQAGRSVLQSDLAVVPGVGPREGAAGNILLPVAPASGLLSCGPGRLSSSSYAVSPGQPSLRYVFLVLGCDWGEDGNLDSCP